jgi:hypothetical protein
MLKRSATGSAPGLGDTEILEQLVVVAVHRLQLGLTAEELVPLPVEQLGQPLALRASGRPGGLLGRPGWIGSRWPRCALSGWDPISRLSSGTCADGYAGSGTANWATPSPRTVLVVESGYSG